jgi:hypothetical protein
MVIESEIQSWNRLRDALASQAERQAFDVMMDYCRKHSMAGSNACRPVLFEPMVMSILVEQQKLILKLQHEFEVLRGSAKTTIEQKPRK